MRKILKKVLICILILFILNNFFIGNLTSNISYAATFQDNVGALEKLFSTVVGLLTWPLRLVAMGIGLAVDKLMSAVAYIEGRWWRKYRII